MSLTLCEDVYHLLVDFLYLGEALRLLTALGLDEEEYIDLKHFARKHRISRMSLESKVYGLDRSIDYVHQGFERIKNVCWYLCCLLAATSYMEEVLPQGKDITMALYRYFMDRPFDSATGEYRLSFKDAEENACSPKYLRYEGDSPVRKRARVSWPPESLPPYIVPEGGSSPYVRFADFSPWLSRRFSHRELFESHVLKYAYDLYGRPFVYSIETTLSAAELSPAYASYSS